MKSPQFLFVDIALLAAGLAAIGSEPGPGASSLCSRGWVEVASTDSDRMILVIEGECLPPPDVVCDAIASCCGKPAAVAIGHSQRGWEVVYLPPDSASD